MNEKLFTITNDVATFRRWNENFQVFMFGNRVFFDRLPLLRKILSW